MNIFDANSIDISKYTGLTSDSRAVKPGMIFAALPGTLADGRDYIEQALENGAGAILSTPNLPDLPVPYFADDNPRRLYAELAARFHVGHPKTIVAMTGTNGKSSTVEFLRQIWAYAGLNAACFGTLGIQSSQGYRPLTHTTPDAMALHATLSELTREGVTHVAMEASSHGLDQARLDAVTVSVSGFSNLTQDHFDYHSDADDYFAAKARLFTELTPKSAPVIINVNDEYGQRLSKICEGLGQKVVRVGWSGEDVRIDEVMPRASSQMIDLVVSGTRHKIELPLAGEFQVLNAVAAFALARETGVSEVKALEALAHLHGVAGRLERAGQTQDGAPIFVDFAHTEDGLDKLLRSVRPHTLGKIVIVFGCGGDRDPDKRAKMGRIAAKLADSVIVTDDNPRTENATKIRKAVLVGCPNALEIGDRTKAIRVGIEQLGPQDCLVIAGKGHEQGQIVGTKVIPFCDVTQARQALKELGHV